MAQTGDAPLRTNDHWLSLTDQMNLGVRAVELDTHWVEVCVSPWHTRALLFRSACLAMMT